MPLNIINADITTLRVDAIVNAANTGLAMGGGVCGAIFNAAGAREMQAACDKLAPICTGDAVITPGFRLPAKFVIHTAGPIYGGGSNDEQRLLRAAYISSLSLAVENNCESVAFPLISSGIYGYPREEALSVATTAIAEFLAERDSDIDVSLVIFDRASFAVGRNLLGEVEAYIDGNYIGEHDMTHGFDTDQLDFMVLYAPTSVDAGAASFGSLDDIIGNLDEPFSETLLRLIDAKGFKKDSEVYTRANIDRRLFSKIRGNKNYAPSKPTVLAFAVALRLTLDETEDLLERAGFALSHSRKFDVIVEYFIASGKYDIFEINNVLFEYDQPLLGGA
ncbi:MAG: macro domain-containing protein [Oscillospiraceae bacterium]|nr:macro domain-containing protein [Oscillospiraceae bacterium]